MSERDHNLPEAGEVTMKEIPVAYRTADSDVVYPLRTREDRGWEEFRDQCRRQMQRPLELRINYGFCRMYKPVLDDAPWRAFDSMAEYRAWCAANLPDYLGFKPAKRIDQA